MVLGITCITIALIMFGAGAFLYLREQKELSVYVLFMAICFALYGATMVDEAIIGAGESVPVIEEVEG